MNVVLLGPPGSGKGTQAKRIEQTHGIPQLATGYMLRAATLAETPLGRRVKSIMDAGELVADDIIIALIRERIGRPDCRNGFVLDGFPRTVPQAEALDRMLVDRLTGRFTCQHCGASYHERDNRPKVDGICDVCGACEFICRPDDSPETVKARLDVYRRQTAPLLPYYRKTGILQQVDGSADIDTVTREIEAVIAGI